MKKTIIILIALCTLLCSCNAANAKTLEGVASSATTLTQELKSVRNSGGAVTVEELFELETIELIETTPAFWCLETQKEYPSPWKNANTTNSFSIEKATETMNKYKEMGLFSVVKFTVVDEGVEYAVFSTLSVSASNNNIESESAVFRVENTITGEVFYDDSVFEDAEITPVHPETETE